MTLDDPGDLIERVRRHVSDSAAVELAPIAEVAAGTDAPDLPLADYIDHTLLKPEATPAHIDQLCSEAQDYHFASVCVNPCYVEQCASALAESSVAVCTVVGFPLGATTTAVKVLETQQALASGAREIDMVLAIGRLKAGEYRTVLNDMQQVVAACTKSAALCKVILETALLTDEEKVAGCLLAMHAGADFVKTSTGFGGGGATLEDVALMRRAVGPEPGVKASGGIRTAQAARALLHAGATRIGASASVQLVTGA